MPRARCPGLDTDSEKTYETDTVANESGLEK